MNEKDFVHLHLHTDFSLLDGAIKIKPLAKRAQETGARAVAVTDHGNMYGALSFYNQMKGSGVKPIVGMEAYIARGKHTDRGEDGSQRGTNHIILLAKNLQGYHNLAKLSSFAFTRGYYYKPRIDKELLAEHSEGIVALSACLSGVPSSLLLTDKFDEAARQAMEFEDILGKGNYYLEVQNHGLDEETRTVIPGMIELSRRTGIPLVATNDCHYLMQDDWRAHDILVCIGAGKTVNEKRGVKYKEGEFYFRSAKEMWMLFGKDMPEALLNTVAIAEMCDLEIPMGENHLPIYRVPAGETIDTYFKKVAKAGLEQRWEAIKDRPDRKCDLDDYRARLELEIEVITQMGFPGYFLIVWDFIAYARRASIPVGPGRGSAAGSLVAYCLQITDIDPLQYDLLFERFLNPERVSMPDIDIDFCVKGRQQVIDYVADYYGRDHVAQISTFGTMASKAAIKDVGRALEMPYAEVDKIAKMIPPPVRGRNVSIEDAIKQNPDLKKAIDADPRVKDVIEIAQRLEGCSRHSSVHAAGVVISPRPIYELVPVSKTSRDEITTQYTMTDLEKTGMLKMDFLALTTLTIIDDCLKSIKREAGIDLDLSKIPLDDKASLQLFADGKTEAIFQFESEGMKDICRRLKPEGLEDLSALNALYRPGPIDSGMVDDFIERRHGRKKVRYDFPELKEVMGNTLGICVAGDTTLIEARSGELIRIDEMAERSGDFYVQGVDSESKPRIARVTDFICNGFREVVELKLYNGASVKLTPDHKVLTESGWREIKELKAGDFIATPRSLTVTGEKEHDLRQLRVIAYLLADGSLSSTSCNADFVSKDEALIKEYKACLSAFERVEPRMLQQVHGVTRVMAAGVNKTHYHEVNSLVAVLRQVGLKSKKGGCRSDEKFVPDFVFGLTQKCLAFFLASLWDCDGYIGQRLCHYKTISKQLSQDVQTLLLRLGIHSTIYESRYHSERREGETTAYQVTVYNLKAFRDLIAPYLISKSMADSNFSGIETKDSVSRPIFLTELSRVWRGTGRSLMQIYGIDRQHVIAGGRRKGRIATHVVTSVANTLSLPRTSQNLNIRWEGIKEIRATGVEKVYDITVEGIHNFVGNNIILHNCVYQEQLMAVFQKLAGYSLGEADLVRRAMGKKKREELDKHKVKFLKQATERGHDKSKLEKLWHSFEGFADYAFNRAHSFSYGYLAYQTAFLKAHYSTHFWAAVLSNELNNTAKVVKYINEARTQGIQILPPDVNASFDNFTASGNTIRFGLAAIKGIGQSAVASIIEARNTASSFRSIYDFTERVDSKAVNKRVLESLIRAGAFDSQGHSRARLFAAIDIAMETGQRSQRSRATGQADLFGALAAAAPVANMSLPQAEEWTNQELLKGEKETLGFYISGHPLMRYEGVLSDFANVDVDRLSNMHHGAQVAMGGIITDLNVRTTKKGDRFGLLQLEDQFGTVKVVAWPEPFGKANSIMQNDTAVLVKGRLEIDDGGSMTIIADEIQALENIRERSARTMVIHLKVDSIDTERLESLHALLDRHRGDCGLRFDILMPDGSIARVQPNQFVRIKASPDLTNAITQIFSDSRVELQGPAGRMASGRGLVASGREEVASGQWSGAS